MCWALFSVPANDAGCVVCALVLYAGDDVVFGGVGAAGRGVSSAVLARSAQPGRRQVVVGAFQRPLQIPERGACILVAPLHGWAGLGLGKGCVRAAPQ